MGPQACGPKWAVGRLADEATEPFGVSPDVGANPTREENVSYRPRTGREANRDQGGKKMKTKCRLSGLSHLRRGMRRAAPNNVQRNSSGRAKPTKK